MIAVPSHVPGNLVHGRNLRAFGLQNIEDIGRTEPNQYRRVLLGNVFLGFLILLPANANNRSEDADALLAFLYAAAKSFPLPESGNPRCVRLLPCDFEDVSKAVVVKTTHRVEVRGECIAVSCL